MQTLEAVKKLEDPLLMYVWAILQNGRVHVKIITVGFTDVREVNYLEAEHFDDVCKVVDYALRRQEHFIDLSAWRCMIILYTLFWDHLYV